jgi:hypothetical protein
MGEWFSEQFASATGFSVSWSKLAWPPPTAGAFRDLGTVRASGRAMGPYGLVVIHRPGPGTHLRC